MIKKLGELTVSKTEDFYDKIAKTLEDCGFTLVLEIETSTDRYYIVAEDEERNKIQSDERKESWE